MPWNSQQGGGGPWGSPGGGGQNPWGGRGGASPPDLEEMLRRSQDRVRRFLPRGLGGGRGFWAIVAIVVLLWAATGIYRVQEGQQGVVQRFGQFVGITAPGLHYHLPAPIETVTTPNVERINRIEIGFDTGPDSRQSAGSRDIPEESLMLTGDENIIDIDFTVLWRIASASDYLFNLSEPEETVKTAAESAMREIIGQTDIQPALTEARNEIENSTRTTLQRILDEYQSGIEVVEVQLQRVDPPAPVVDSFNEVQRARQDQDRQRNEAETYRNDIIPRARGDAERTIQEASAFREQVVDQAEGDAQRFISVYNAYAQAPDVTAQRLYLETLETVLGDVNKVIIDDAAAASGVVPYLPLDALQRRPAAQKVQP